MTDRDWIELFGLMAAVLALPGSYGDKKRKMGEAARRYNLEEILSMFEEVSATYLQTP